MVNHGLVDVESGVRTLLGIFSGRWVFGGPRAIALILSRACNSSCVMCWYHSPKLIGGARNVESTDGEHPEFMDLALCETIIRECHDLRTYRVILGGHGEPTLNPDFDRILGCVTDRGMAPYVITNGLAVDETRAREWAGCRAHFRFSVHAGSEESWLRIHPQCSSAQFARLERVIRRLAESDRARVSTMHVLQKANYRDVQNMVLHAHNLGVRQVEFLPVRTDDGSNEVLLDREEERELRDELRLGMRLAEDCGIRTNIGDYLQTNRFIRAGSPVTADFYRTVPCYVGWLYAEFDIDGTMRPCENSDIVLGRAGEVTVREMWHSRPYHEYRRQGRAMARRGMPVRGCPCHACCMSKFNANVHNLLRLRSLRYDEA